MIVCAKCSKENQDHYKFCLGCGAELSRDKGKKSFGSDTPPHGVSAVDAAPAAMVQPAPEPDPAPGFDAGGELSPMPPVAAAAEPPIVEVAAAPTASEPGKCPQCGHVNQPAHRFCASCGFNLAALQAAPAPAAVVSTQAVMLTALRADGSEAGSFPLPDDMRVVVGRDTGSIFAGDSYLSPKHACFLQ